MPRPKGSKNLTTTERINAVEGMLLAHYTETQVIHVCKAQWAVGARTARKYIDTVRRRWIEENEHDLKNKRAAAVARLHAAGRVAQKNPAVLVQVERELSYIEGTRAPTQFEGKLDINLQDLTDEQLARVVAGEPLDKVLGRSVGA